MIRNLVPLSHGMWTVEWPDATGTFYPFRVYGRTEEAARASAESFATNWANYTYDPVQGAKDVEDVLNDYATRTYHGD